MRLAANETNVWVAKSSLIATTTYVRIVYDCLRAAFTFNIIKLRIFTHKIKYEDCKKTKQRESLAFS